MASSGPSEGLMGHASVLELLPLLPRNSLLRLTDSLAALVTAYNKIIESCDNLVHYVYWSDRPCDLRLIRIYLPAIFF